MGLGKTVFALLMYIVKKWIAIADTDVEKDRERKASAYLPASFKIYQQPANAICPSDKFFFRCPYIKTLTTKSWHPLDGVNVVIVPKNLLNI